MKTITLTHRLSDLGAFLRGTDADENITTSPLRSSKYHLCVPVKNEQ